MPWWLPDYPGTSPTTPTEDTPPAPLSPLWLPGSQQSAPGIDPEIYYQILNPPPPVASRPILAETARTSSEIQATVAAFGAVVPTIYGQVQIGPKIGAVSTLSGDLVLLLIWALGEVQSIDNIQLADEESTAGMTFTHYTGTTSQGVDSTLSSAIPGYMDDLVFTRGGQTGAFAYTVARVPPSDNAGFPQFVATISGVKVYDPRTLTTAYSDNPALALAHYITDPQHGLGRTIDWTSVESVADACDETLSDTTKRRRIGLALQAQASPSSWLETLRTYAGCFIYEQDGVYTLVKNRPLVSFTSILASDIVADSFRLEKRNLRDSPTVVRVRYTSRADNIWEDRETEPAMLTGVSAGTVPWRESLVALPGIFTAAQAYREAIERLNHSNSQDLIAAFALFDEGLELNPGDGLEITHPMGLTAVKFRLVTRETVSPGRYNCLAVAYDAAVYSDETDATEYTYGGDALESPAVVPTVMGLLLDDTVYQKANGEYATRIDISWTALTYSYLDSYEVLITDLSLNVIYQTPVPRSQVAIATPEVQELIEYTVQVRARSTAGVAGAWTSDTIIPDAKAAAPTNVAQITATRIGADLVQLEWLAASDFDLECYVIKEGASWAAGTEIDCVDGLSRIIEGVSLGAHTYRVKARDSVGNESLADASVNITLTAPAAITGLFGFEAGGTVYLRWNASTSPYVSHYEVRHGLVAGYSWASATVGDEIDGLRYVDATLAEGSYRFEVRSVDDAGNYSTGATIDIAVTISNATFVADQIELVSPALTNVSAINSYQRYDGAIHYVTDAGDTMASMFPSAMSTYTNALLTYHGSVSADFLTDTNDSLAQLTGEWTVYDSDITALGGAIVKQLELSTDDISYTPYTAMNAKTTARYSRVRVTSDTTNTLLVKLPPMTLRVNVIPREEVGSGAYSATTHGAAGLTITLDQVYTLLKAVTLTPAGSDPVFAVVDNITIGNPTTFSIIAFDEAGNFVDATVYWKWEGV